MIQVSKMYTTFTVIRHGETAANLKRVIQGQTDVPLNASGEEQARLLGRRWRNRRFDAVYSSDLSRALRTAELALPGQRPIPTRELREMDLGEWCGRTTDEIAKLFPEEWNAFRTGSVECRAKNGESRREVLHRTERFFSAAARKHAGGDVLVVTHGGVLRAFFLMLFGGEDADFSLLPATGNTGISTAKFDLDTGEWRLISWNDTAHLEALLDGDDAY